MSRQSSDIDKKLYIPPITVKNKESWPALKQHIKTNKIQINQVSDGPLGIKIKVQDVDHHRKLTKVLTETKQQHFSHPLPEEKTLRVVTRGVLGLMSLKNLEECLIEDGFKVVQIDLLYKKDANGKKILFPLALVQLPRTEKSKEIYFN